MIAAFSLGLRLAWPTATAARWRSVMMVGAAAVAAFVMLGALAIAHAEKTLNPSVYADPGMQRVLFASVATIALPILVLLSVAAKLSAQLRERRLANLRLLGMPPSSTRVVAVTEVGVSALGGALLGVVGFWLLRPPLSHISVAGRSWSTATLTPGTGGYAVVVLAVAMAVVVVAGWPRGADRAGALAVSHASVAKRPSWLRLVPLLVGVVLSTYVLVAARGKVNVDPYIPPFFVGVALLGLGVVLFVPILVRVVADLLLAAVRRPTLVIAGRRLQSQPVGVNRIVSGLVIGLFLVTGARGVLVAFENTSQYRDANAQIHHQQTSVVDTTTRSAATIESRIRDVPDVTSVTVFPRLQAVCDPGTICPWAIVASCAQLRALAPQLTGCSDTHPTWREDAKQTFPVAAQHQQMWRPTTPRDNSPMSARLNAPRGSLRGTGSFLFSLGTDVVIPPGLAGVHALSRASLAELYVTAQPGRDLDDRLLAVPGVELETSSEFEAYDFVAKLRALVWAIATVIVSLGLLTFAVAAIDRAISRRREVVSLQIIGVGRRTLRITQWVEAVVPLVIGCLLAIGCGLLASATYLSIAGEGNQAPWRAGALLALVASLGSLAVAGLTVIASSPRIRPDLIRSE
jgi:putative ABC transport system permease protein